jgi:uncharacterized membrane protein YtjA (UPF0391 family)
MNPIEIEPPAYMGTFKGISGSGPELAVSRSSESLRVWCRVDAQGGYMLGWALAFFLIAIVAAVFGFGGIASASAGIAKILFFIFVVIFLVTLIMGMARRV